ncbi:MAG: response regulator [Bacteroidota bacterium]
MEDTRRILIIEDNQSFRVLMNHFLSKSYQVVTKCDGLSAMKWLRQGNQTDLILLDLGMPLMTGKDFLMGLKSSGFFQHIPVIIVSGNNPATFTTSAMNDIQYYFEKPFDPVKLREKIEQIFTEKANSISFH